jgi:hypothetical protein
MKSVRGEASAQIVRLVMVIDLVVMVIALAHPATVLSVVLAHLSVMVIDRVVTATVLSAVTLAIDRVVTATARTVTQPQESTVSQELTLLQW